MKILVLAPHPFYQDRGTPIDVLLVLRVLSERRDTHVDVVTYHEGEDIDLPNVRLVRIKRVAGIKKIRPGFSFKKVVCDILLFFKAFELLRKNRYDFIHAGEETVFYAMLFKRLFGIPFAYDLDSSIAQQLVEKKPFLRMLSPVFNWLERSAIRDSLINFPVCNALADLCESSGSVKTVTLHDISQLNLRTELDKERLRRETDARGVVYLYSGNLEAYQGIDLLLESFAIAIKTEPGLFLVIIGGQQEDIEYYQRKAALLGLSKHVRFLGPRPFNDLGEYLVGADVLVCPRIKGINTPMKIFPYLHSGTPVLATDLWTHNQVLTSNEAYLAPADPEGFAKGIVLLARDTNLRIQLGRNGRRFVEVNHTFEAHRRRLNDAYDWIVNRLSQMYKTHEVSQIKRLGDAVRS